MIRSVDGKNVVVAGKFNAMSKRDIEQALKALGAKIDMKFSGRTEIIFAGENSDKITTRARMSETPIYDETQLLALLNGAGPTLEEVIGAMRRFAIGLKRRHDVTVERAVVGDVAEDFDIAWHFTDSGLGGGVHVQPGDFDDESGLIEFLGAGVEAGFASDDAVVARFQTEPKPLPKRFDEGTRIGFRYYAEGARGVILENRNVPYNRETEFYGDVLARVQTDEGTEAWIPHRFMEIHWQHDAYEWMRDPEFDFLAGDDLMATLEDVARAIGPMRHYSMSGVGMLSSNGRRAAGLLSERTFEDAVQAVVKLYEATLSERIKLWDQRAFHESGDEFHEDDFKRYYFHTVGKTLEGLFSGLMLRARHESNRLGVKGNELIDADWLQRVEQAEPDKALADVLNTDAVLALPDWEYNDHAKAKKALKIPVKSVLFSGTGY